MLRIRAMTEADRDWAAAVVARYFGSPEMVSRGFRHDTRLLPGLIAEEGGQRLGLAHYRIADELEYERRLDGAAPVGAPHADSAGAASTSVT